MGLPEELCCAMLKVGHCARNHKIPGPLAHTMIDIAQKSLELWRRDEKTAMRFAAGMLAGPTISGRQLDSFLNLSRPHVGGSSGCWNITMADSRLAKIYYSPRGYWKGLAAIEKLASAAKVTEQQAKDWLKRQAIWQIYLPAPRRVPRPKFHVAVPYEVHQADLLFLPHDRVGRKTFRYALTVVDVASSYKEAEPLTSKTAAEVADALSRIYGRGPLKWPQLLQVDPMIPWALSASCWQSTLFRFGAVGLTSTGTKASWSAGTGPWHSGSFDTNTHRR